MITLTAEQRNQLMQVVEGDTQGCYLAALIMLNLAEGRDRGQIAKTCFCSLEEIDGIVGAFERGGVRAVIEFEVQP